MASIKGVQMKSLTVGKGHDGGGFHANLYLNNKKIGTVLDDGWGGHLQIDVLSEKEKFQEAAKAFYVEHPPTMDSFTQEEHIIYELLNLTLNEKEFKKAIKTGYKAILTVDYRPLDENGKYRYDCPIPYPTHETYLLPTVEESKEVLDEKKPSKHQLFKDLNDFVLV